MDLATAFNTSWPLLLVGAVALALAWWLLNRSITSLRQTLAQLAAAQGKAGLGSAEIDRCLAQLGAQQSDLATRLAACERAVQQQQQQLASEAEQRQRAAAQASAEDHDGSPEALQRFDAAAETLARLARELDGLDVRQNEQLLRIQGDLHEQGFHLQRVQQHVDRLLVPGAAASAELH